MHENISYMAIAIAICRLVYVFRVGGSNITGEINYPPLHSVLNTNSKGDKIFQRGPNISENLFRGPGSKNFSKIEIHYPGVQIFRYIWTGGK